MRLLLTAALVYVTVAASAQDKNNYVHYDKLTEVKGTSYVIASIENWGKMLSTKGRYLLFIDTRTGQSKQIDFPKDAFIGKVEQVKIDSLGINNVIITANTVNLDGNKSIDWNDPTQVIVFSPDGQQRVQVTEDHFFVRTWVVNNQSGTIVIAGHYDTNNNGKYDKTDKEGMVIYDLKAMKVVAKL